MKINTTNPNHLIYDSKPLQLEVMGGIDLKYLNRLRVTLKVTRTDKQGHPLRDQLDLYQDSQLTRLTRRIAEKFETGVIQAEKTMYHLTEKLEHYRFEELNKKEQPINKTSKELTLEERTRALEYLQSKNLLNRTKQSLQQTGIVGEEGNALTLFLCLLSRKLDTPLSAICLAQSGLGKSHLMEKVAACIPKEDKEENTSLTPNSIYYFSEKSLKHKALLIEDLDGASNVMYALRELISKKSIKKRVTVKDTKGEFKSILVEVEGPVSLIGCTTQENLYEDNANRCLLLHLDGSKTQDEKIMSYHKALKADQIDKLEEENHQKELEHADRLLKKIRIINPLRTINRPTPRSKQTKKNPPHVSKLHRNHNLLPPTPKKRRSQPRNRRNLYPNHNRRHRSSLCKLFKPILIRKSDELTEGERTFYETLQTWNKKRGENTFKSLDIREEIKLTPRSIERYLKQLTSYGKIKQIGGSRQKGYNYILKEDTQKLAQSIESQITQIIKRIKKATPTTKK